MDLSWDDSRTRKFVTNLALITSNGPYGYNISTLEWAHHVSYAPSLIMLSIHEVDATHANIKETKQFGINLAASDQNFLSSIAGGSSGKDVDKIKILQELGVEFYKAKTIDVLMVKGAAMNAECKLIESFKIGDHIGLIGQVLDIAASEKPPLIYSSGKYWHFGEQVHKPPQDFLDKINQLVTRYKK